MATVEKGLDVALMSGENGLWEKRDQDPLQLVRCGTDGDQARGGGCMMCSHSERAWEQCRRL